MIRQDSTLCYKIRINSEDGTAQTMTTRMLLKWIATFASILWIAATIYQGFFAVDPTQFGFRSTEVEARMKSCGGSFQQRYDCKEEIIIAKGYDSFLLWVEKATLVLAPPLILGLFFNRTGREKPPKIEQNFEIRRPSSIAKRRVR
jgi:hypothetical protein